MKIKELFENNKSSEKLEDPEAQAYLEKLIDFTDKIRRDCQPFLKELESNTKHRLLYRGLKSTTQPFIIKHTTEERNIKDTPKFISDLFDKATEKIFGVKFRTQNVFFANPNGNIAGDYSIPSGTVFSVYPIGDFKYIWSNRVLDFYESDFYYEIITDIKTGNDMSVDNMIKKIKEWKYTDTNLGKALNGDNEIMVHAKSYYGIDSNALSDFLFSVGKNAKSGNLEHKIMTSLHKSRLTHSDDERFLRKLIFTGKLF